jgi:hypothetical protein
MRRSSGASRLRFCVCQRSLQALEQYTAFLLRPWIGCLLHMGETDAWLAIRQDCFVTTSPTRPLRERHTERRRPGPMDPREPFQLHIQFPQGARFSGRT